jgi:membrane protease subunit HflK
MAVIKPGSHTDIMAWNEPGNRGESPWGKKRPAGNSGGGIEQTLKELQQKLQAALGNARNEPPAGGGAAAGPGSGGVGVPLAVVLALLWLASGLFQIEASEIGVVQRFGAYTSQRPPGIGWAFPWPIEKVTKVNVSLVNSVEYNSRVLTADVNLVEIGATIQYVNADPVKVLFQVKDLETTLAEVGESALREVVGQATLDDVLGAARQRITDAAKDLMQRTLDSYNSGVRISSVNLTNVQVPDAVVGSQREANKAIEDRERFAQEARAYANDILPRAQGTAQRMLQDAEAYKAQVVALAEGDVARFNSIYAAYAKAPEVTRRRMAIETMEQIYREAPKILLDTPSGSGNMIYLPLDRWLERNGAARGAVTTPNDGQSTQPNQELPTITVDGRTRGTR